MTASALGFGPAVHTYCWITAFHLEIIEVDLCEVDVAIAGAKSAPSLTVTLIMVRSVASAWKESQSRTGFLSLSIG